MDLSELLETCEKWQFMDDFQPPTTKVLKEGN